MESHKSEVRRLGWLRQRVGSGALADGRAILTDRLAEWSARLALPLIMLWALATRLWDLRQPFIGDQAWNEVYYAHIARSFFTGSLLVQPDITYVGNTVSSSPFVPWIIYGSFRLFGLSEWAGRLPMLVAGMLALVCLYGLVKVSLGSARLALAATFLAASMPGVVFFSRNIQLDGVMTTLGLGALLLAALYRRDGLFGYLAGSLVLMALAILAKMPAILFWPALAWIWLDGQASPDAWRNWRRWLSLALYGVLSLLPAVAWMLISSADSASGHSMSTYLLRVSEWQAGNFASALLSLWGTWQKHAGTLILGPAVLLGLVVVLTLEPRRWLRAQALPLLIFLPWYAQLVYPLSWLANEYYTYPSLFGLSIVLAALGLAAFDHAARWLQWSLSRRVLFAALAASLILFSNFWDYRRDFHSLYYPWPVIQEPAPFASARHVAALNVAGEPILSDVTFTLYYANGNLDRDRYMWWHPTDAAILSAIEGRHYKFVVFKYLPTVNILNTIAASGYKQIAPGAWQRIAEPAP